MNVKGLTGLILTIAIFLIAAPTAVAKPADRDRDGIRDRHERSLGTSPKHFTKARNYVNRVVSYKRSSGKLIFYRAKGQPVYAVVDEESVVFCTDEYYWLDEDDFEDSNGTDDEFDDNFDDEFGDGLDEDEPDGSAPCLDSAIRRGDKIDEAKLSYYHGNFFIDSLHLL